MVSVLCLRLRKLLQSNGKLWAPVFTQIHLFCFFLNLSHYNVDRKNLQQKEGSDVLTCNA